MMAQGGRMTENNHKPDRLSKRQTLMVLGTAQGRQTFESSRMPEKTRREVRASFKKASSTS